MLPKDLWYDPNGQMIFSKTEQGDTLFADIRGFGYLLNKYGVDKALEIMDSFGEKLVEAYNSLNKTIYTLRRCDVDDYDGDIQILYEPIELSVEKYLSHYYDNPKELTKNLLKEGELYINDSSNTRFFLKKDNE